MATAYFTSNADSGSGTLRAAIASAVEGDVIAPDPDVFTSGPITIALSSVLINTTGITIDGGSIGIVLDGQNTNISAISLAVAGETTLVNCTIKRFKRTTAAPVYINNADAVLNLHRCVIADNSNRYYGSIYVLRGTVNLFDSLVTGNDITTNNNSYAGIYIASNGVAVATRSTVSGNVNANISGTTRFTNINSFVGLTAPEIDGVTPEEIGFVVPPPYSSITYGEYTEGDWQTWDFRLKPTSPYLTGASYQSGDKDLLGHDRTGSWGCYDGSWFVVPANGTATVSSDTTVDYAEIGSGATVNFTNANLTVTKNADIYTSTFASSSTAYLAVPSGTYFNLSTFTNVVHCTYGGGVTAIAGSVDLRTCTFSVTKTGTETVDCIEYKTEADASWSKIVNLTDSSSTFSTVTDKGFYLRAYDGVNFVTSSWIPRTYYYKGSATSGSFATSSDWAMNAQKTLTCNAAPSIKEGTFHCE